MIGDKGNLSFSPFFLEFQLSENISLKLISYVFSRYKSLPIPTISFIFAPFIQNP